MNKENDNSFITGWRLNFRNEIPEPKTYQEYVKIKVEINNALEQKSLCKTLCLIIDGVNYNQIISKEYYKQSGKDYHSPKVTTQYLKKLRVANIIVRGEKDGKIQPYEVNWKGLFDIIRFRNIEDWQYFSFFKLSNWFYHPHEIYYQPKLQIKKWTCIFSEKEMEKITEEFIEKFFKPYIKKFIDYRLKFNLEDGTSYKTDNQIDNPSEAIKELSNINFDILYMLHQFDNEMTALFPRVFQQEFSSLINSPDLEKTSKLIKFLLARYNEYYKLEDYKIQYLIPENPEIEILNSFNNQVKKIGFELTG